MTMHIDGDFNSGLGDCKWHCFPTCHPMQIGPELVFGCRHPAWPQNRPPRDFVPIVQCGGEVAKCDLRGKAFVARYKGGLTQRLNSALRKARHAEEAMREIKELMGEKK